MIAAALLGAVGAAGVLLMHSGWRPTRTETLRTRVGARQIWIRPQRLAVPVVCGAAAVLLTRWPAAAILGALAGRLIVNRQRKVDEAARAEAIALWIEQIRNAVRAADGVETVLGDSARHAPTVIRADVQQAIAHLADRSLDDVLTDLAARLAHPSGDQVVRALRQAAAEGGSLGPALDGLAKRTRSLAEMHRRIDVAREQPRSTLRAVTVVIAAFTGILLLVARDWMSAYASSAGQVVLLLVTAWFVFWYDQMSRMSRLAPTERFYARTAQQ